MVRNMLESLNAVNAAKTVRQSGDDAFIRVRFYKQTNTDKGGIP